MSDPFPLRNYEETLMEAARAPAPRPVGLWARIKMAFAMNPLDDDFVPAGAMFDSGLPRTAYPYGRATGDGGLNSNVVMSPVNWVLRNFTEAELVTQRNTRGQWEPVPDHPLTMKLEAPNDFYDGDTLWKATGLSWFLDGNAYWYKVRSNFGNVVELWYLPHFLVEPKWPQGEADTFISHYQYRPWYGGPPSDLKPRDVVHFRNGLDPRNTRKGLSAVKTILREVFTDDEAANFSASILRNMGVPGGVIAPKDGSVLPSDSDIQEMKEYMRTAFTGDRRGEWMVSGVPTMVEQFGFDPNQLMLGNLRDIAEERVCAAIGIPAAVVGFGAGLQQTKVGATMKELRRSSWVNCVIPTQNTLGKQVTRQLMPDFQSQSRRFRVRFDVSGVSAFAEEEKETAERAGLLYEKGVATREEARDMVGLPPTPTGEFRQEPQPAPSMNGTGPKTDETNRVAAATAGRREA